jgi:Ca-activated chloride channel family protein
MITQFHFLRAEWLWLLLPVALLIAGLLLRKRHLSTWEKACDPHLLPHLLVNRDHSRDYWPLALLSIAWMCSIIALAGPTWSHLPQMVYRSVLSRVIVLEASAVMNATDLAPNRMTRAKYKIMDMLKLAKEQRTGLVVFSEEAFTASPLTEDSNNIALLVPMIDPQIMPVQGHNITSGLEQAEKLLKQAQAPEGEIILLTASVPTAQDYQTATAIRKKGYSISVLGIGTQQNVPLRASQGGFETDSKGAIVTTQLDNAALAKLAADGGGVYREFTVDNKDINALLNTSLQQKLATQSHLTQEVSELWLDQGRWFILIAMLIAVWGFRRGWFNEVLR